MDQSSKKECIVITGATGALGRVTVRHFLKRGYTVYATASSAGETGSLPSHERLKIHEVDLRNETAAAAFIDKITKDNFAITAAFLLAGGYAGGNIFETGTEAIQQQIDLNFFTAFNIAKPVFEHMAANRGGRMIFMAAKPALKASDGKKSVAYGLSKSLLVKLAEYLNEEGKNKNIVSAVVVPGTLDTEANRSAMPEADFSKWTDLNAVASTFEFLVSEPASVLREPVMKLYNAS